MAGYYGRVMPSEMKQGAFNLGELSPNQYHALLDFFRAGPLDYFRNTGVATFLLDAG